MMPKVMETDLPSNVLSVSYKEQGAFVDCYYINIEKEIHLDEYLKVFYTTALFKLDRSLSSLVTFKRH